MKKFLSGCMFVCLSFFVACSNTPSLPTEADALRVVNEEAGKFPGLKVVSVKKTNGQLRKDQGVNVYLMNVAIQFDCSHGGGISIFCTSKDGSKVGVVEFQQTEKGWAGELHCDPY